MLWCPEACRQAAIEANTEPTMKPFTVLALLLTLSACGVPFVPFI